MLKYLAAAVIIGFAEIAAAQQPQLTPNWEELALQAQKNATLDQMLANGIIASLQKELEALKAELAKPISPPLQPAPEAPK